MPDPLFTLPEGSTERVAELYAAALGKRLELVAELGAFDTALLPPLDAHQARAAAAHASVIADELAGALDELVAELPAGAGDDGR